MTLIYYIDRKTKTKKIEKVYKNNALNLVYGSSFFNKFLNKFFLPLITRNYFFSTWYGWLQKRPKSSRKIEPFIKNFEVNTEEFLYPISSFQSFNDFFIRKLKPEARPIEKDSDCAIIPADGRYFFYENIKKCDGFLVKEQKFDLSELLQNNDLANEYQEGSMVLARLCPSDYHRFHFPCGCIPGPTSVINGWLNSVNPMAVKQNIRIMSQNKRTLCRLQSKEFGQILFLEVGALCVGRIQQTYLPNQEQKKGNEKGYFEFGGSSLIILFQKNKILFDPDLLEATKQGLEIYCQMGQKMGRKSQRNS